MHRPLSVHQLTPAGHLGALLRTPSPRLSSRLSRGEKAIIAGYKWSDGDLGSLSHCTTMCAPCVRMHPAGGLPGPPLQALLSPPDLPTSIPLTPLLFSLQVLSWATLSTPGLRDSLHMKAPLFLCGLLRLQILSSSAPTVPCSAPLSRTPSSGDPPSGGRLPSTPLVCPRCHLQ